MGTLADQAKVVGATASAVGAAATAETVGVNHDALAPIRQGKLVLKRGAEGEAVRDVQQMLGVKPDGDFGPKTENAVREFQRKHSLGVDGKIGRQTLQVLDQLRAAELPKHGASSGVSSLSIPKASSDGIAQDPKLSYPTLKEGDHGQVVIALKKQLNQLDCKPKLNETNDRFDKPTQEAVANFQAEIIRDYPHLKRHHDKPTGVVTPTTWHWMEVKLEEQNTGINKIRREISQFFAPEAAPREPATAETFNKALKFTLGAEGGKSSDPDDRGNRGGNVTISGITQPSLNYYCKVKGIPAIDMRQNTPSDNTVRDFYKTLYWKPVENLKLPECLAISYFDCGVLFGPQATKCMLADALGFPPNGKLTSEALERLQGEDAAVITRRLNACADAYVTKLCERRPRNEKFEAGWRLRTERRDIASGVAPGPRAPLAAVVPSTEVAPITIHDMHQLVADVQKSIDPATAPSGEGDANFYRRLMGR